MKMSDQELLKSVQGAVKQEKKLTAIVLDHLAEIERRKVYCDLGISSLFRYCVDILGYSEAESAYRVNATRLVSSSPFAKKSMEEGKLSLSAASKIFGHIKQEQKRGDGVVLPNQVSKIIKKSEGRSTRQLDLMLAEISTVPVERKERVELNERILKKIEKLRKIYGERSDLEVLEMVLDDKIFEMELSKPKRTSSITSENPRYIDRAKREHIYARSGGQCEYVSLKTGKRCNARLHLQIDHINPLALGGKTEISNLRHLCFAHNQRAAITVLGQTKMDRYVDVTVKPKSQIPGKTLQGT